VGLKWTRKKQNLKKEQCRLVTKTSRRGCRLKDPRCFSDEERLAASISMIGLQTKKPSGAQQRKLTRERKMKEGTWMENPPRKTPPSQAKGTVGGSGG
jgi:hypothetical protein